MLLRIEMNVTYKAFLRKGKRNLYQNQFRYQSKTVAVAMSGGIDSAVSAMLLKESGYNCIGIFMKNWDSSDETGSSGCNVLRDFEDMKLVCQKLGIKSFEVEFVKDYWNNVFEPFLDTYKTGHLTPNPDVMCNKYIKFRAFKDHIVKKHGIKWMATGHYANTVSSHLGGYPVGDKDQFTALQAGWDTNKDQSYFLSLTQSRALQNVIFPLGRLTKPIVKEIARNHPILSTCDFLLNKKESMGLCFIGKRKYTVDGAKNGRSIGTTQCTSCDIPSDTNSGLLTTHIPVPISDKDMKLQKLQRRKDQRIRHGNQQPITQFGQFLSQYITLSPGRFIDISTGETLGLHAGKEMYTIGQKANISGVPAKYYVTREPNSLTEPCLERLEHNNNRDRDDSVGDVYVARGKDHPSLYSSRMYVDMGGCNWMIPLPKPVDNESSSPNVDDTRSDMTCPLYAPVLAYMNTHHNMMSVETGISSNAALVLANQLDQQQNHSLFPSMTYFHNSEDDDVIIKTATKYVTSVSFPSSSDSHSGNSTRLGEGSSITDDRVQLYDVTPTMAHHPEFFEKLSGLVFSLYRPRLISSDSSDSNGIISVDAVISGLSCMHRYRQEPVPCQVHVTLSCYVGDSVDDANGMWFVDSSSKQHIDIHFVGVDREGGIVNCPQRSITPGQICTLFDGDICIGAGVICK